MRDNVCVLCVLFSVELELTKFFITNFVQNDEMMSRIFNVWKLYRTRIIHILYSKIKYMSYVRSNLAYFQYSNDPPLYLSVNCTLYF